MKILFQRAWPSAWPSADQLSWCRNQAKFTADYILTSQKCYIKYLCQTVRLATAVYCSLRYFVFWQEVVSGVIVMVCKEAVQHHGIFLSMEGLVNLQLSSKSVGVFEAFYNSVKVKDDWLQESHFCLKLLIQHSCLILQPIQLISSNIEVAKAGKVPPGKTEIPFEFPLNSKSNKVLYETYHGVFVNIQVSERHLWCIMSRTLISTAVCIISIWRSGKLLCVHTASLLVNRCYVFLVFSSVHPPLWSEALPAGQRFE